MATAVVTMASAAGKTNTTKITDAAGKTKQPTQTKKYKTNKTLNYNGKTVKTVCSADGQFRNAGLPNPRREPGLTILNNRLACSTLSLYSSTPCIPAPKPRLACTR